MATQGIILLIIIVAVAVLTVIAQFTLRRDTGSTAEEAADGDGGVSAADADEPDGERHNGVAKDEGDVGREVDSNEEPPVEERATEEKALPADPADDDKGESASEPPADRDRHRSHRFYDRRRRH